MVHDALILGAGIHGLCAAFQLRRRGLRRVAVLERFQLGHDRGSSHGSSRITRASYHDRRYVLLAREANREGWPLLERELGIALLHRTPGLFFGPERGSFGGWLQATLGAGAAVERIDTAAARRSFPLLALADDDAVLLDHSAGLLAAAAAMLGLAAWCREHDVEVREHTPVRALRSEPAAVHVETAHGALAAARVVVAAGAWTGELVPSLRGALVVQPQQVGYVDVDAAAAATRPGAFPVWARIGAAPDDFAYGLPAFGRPGLKLARHVTHGPGVAPDSPREPIDEGALLALARARLTAPVRGLLGSEHCLYTVAPGEDLIVQLHPGDRRIAVIAACSGHGFKFGPVLGRQAAELLGC